MKFMSEMQEFHQMDECCMYIYMNLEVASEWNFESDEMVLNFFKNNHQKMLELILIEPS